MLMEKIGTPAMLEQTAEEAMELAFACLKLARMERGENKVHNRTKEELIDSIAEETADLEICLDELQIGGIINTDKEIEWHRYKMERMKKRLEEVKEQ